MSHGGARTDTGAPAPGLWTVVYVVFGGPIAWTLHLFVSYFLVALACTTGRGGGAAIDVALGVVTLLFAALALGSGVLAYRRWRRLDGPRQGWGEALSDPRGRGGLLWLLGILMAGLFALIIVLAGLPPIFLPTCAAGGGQ